MFYVWKYFQFNIELLEENALCSRSGSLCAPLDLLEGSTVIAPAAELRECRSVLGQTIKKAMWGHNLCETLKFRPNSSTMALSV